ncbi:hypothetical protein Tco_0581766 [Tanacetum coccineum]
MVVCSWSARAHSSGQMECGKEARMSEFQRQHKFRQCRFGDGKTDPPAAKRFTSGGLQWWWVVSMVIGYPTWCGFDGGG